MIGLASARRLEGTRMGVAACEGGKRRTDFSLAGSSKREAVNDP